MSTVDTWTVSNDRHDAAALAQHNAVFAISNGYLGLTGNLCEDRDGPCPVTIINGVYDELDMFGRLRASKRERPWLDPEHFDAAGKSPAVANLPNPLFVRAFVGEREISLGRGAISGFWQELDLRCGLVHYAFCCDDGQRTTRVEMWRLASSAEPHRAYMRYRVTPMDDGVPIRILSGIDGRVHSNVTSERQFAVVNVETRRPESCRLHVRTPARQHDVYMTVVNQCQSVGKPVVRDVVEHDAAYTVYELTSSAGAPITVDRCVTVSCSEDRRHGERLSEKRGLTPFSADGQAFDAALEQQRAAWKTLWDRADVQIDGDDEAQRALRFCIYHLLAAAPRFSDRLSVPVKLLTGAHYQGNTFWDTDLYIEPFYLFTVPELARTCLNFRYAGLDHAREIARGLGHQGAKFAWQAGPYGEECLGEWYHFVHTNIHINADVAYSLMQYRWATGDEAFMRERGIEILVESARFYAARAAYDERRDAYDIHDVAGPDEAHCHSTNNFYTNYLAQRTLRWAADAVERARDGDDRDEIERWRQVAERLTLLFDTQTKLYEQYDGFYKLPPPPPDLLDDRKAWFVPLYRYQALNQPDVVMAMVLFRDELPEDVRRANWDFYKDKSMNFSSMSFGINAIMAADMGELEEAYRNFMITVGMDLDQSLTGRCDTHAGLHGTALGGAWMATVFGFGGVHLSEKGLRINPNLPPLWNSLRFNLVLRGEVVNVSIDRNEVVLTVKGERDVGLPLTVAGQPFALEAGKTCRVRYRD